MSDIKSFLHQFCQKNKKEQPQFEVRPTGPKHRQRFLCEVRIEGYSYVGAGNSTNKKDAQTNASRDYVSYLIREGIVNPNDVPDLQDIPTSGPGYCEALDFVSTIIITLSQATTMWPTTKVQHLPYFNRVWDRHLLVKLTVRWGKEADLINLRDGIT
jgi:hypothetical protein